MCWVHMALLHYFYYLQSTSVGIRSVVESRLTDYIILCYISAAAAAVVGQDQISGYMVLSHGIVCAFFIILFRRSFYKWVVRIVTDLKPPKTVLRPFISYCAVESHLSNLTDIYTYTYIRGYSNFTLVHRRIINTSYYTHYVRRIPNLFYTYICV